MAMNNNQLELHVNNIVRKLDEKTQELEAERNSLKASVAAMVADAVKAEIAKFDKLEFSDGAGGSVTVLVLSRKPKK